MANGNGSGGSVFWKDDEIVVDREGIPHYTGNRPELMREYRKRVLFAYSSLEGDGDTEEKEKRDLKKRQKAFAKKLLNGLHGEAWRACQDLITDMAKLSEERGFQHVLSALQSIEKVTVIKKTEQFDRFFERGFRKRGQALDAYLRSRKLDWAELQELDSETKMSSDLLAYFVLKQSGLSKDDRRQILLNSGSDYNLESIEKAMRVSYYDIHEKEKISKFHDDRRGKGYGKTQKRHYAHLVDDGDTPNKEALVYEAASSNDQAFEYEHDFENDLMTEYESYMVREDEEYQDYGYEAGEMEEEGSDVGASQDEEVYQAFSAMDKQRRSYQESRRKLREVQKQRGFFKGELTFEQRRAAVQKEKERTRCSACGKIGHWAGDAQCQKSSKTSGPHRGKGKSKGKKKDGGKAYLVSDGPLFFTLDDDDFNVGNDVTAYMTSEHEHHMEQDSGYTETDDRRKVRQPEEAASVYTYDGENDAPWALVGDRMPHSPTTSPKSGDPLSRDTVIRRQLQSPVRVEKSDVSIVPVLNLATLKPDLEEMTVRKLQDECERWGIRVSGTKKELIQRLTTLFQGHPVARKGCSKQFVMLSEEEVPGMKTLIYESPSPKVKTLEVASHAAPPPLPSGSRERGVGSGGGYDASSSAVYESPDRRSFRRDKSDPVVQDMEQRGLIRSPAASTSMASPSPSKSEPVGFMPREIGQILHDVPCSACGGDMLLRENRRDGSKFFGCSRFARTGCRHTINYHHGIDMSREALRLRQRG